MIRHMVLWNLKEEYDDKKEDVFLEIKTRLEGLKKDFPAIHVLSVERGINPYGYDICLYAEFTEFSDVTAYLAHPLHKKEQEQISKYIKEKAVVSTVI